MKILRFAVIGSPISHSKSPRMHQAAFDALGMPHTFERLDTSGIELPLRVDELRKGVLAGISVTVPHKTRVLAFADVVAEEAKALGAANTLVRGTDGLVRAHNTDVGALISELSALAHTSPSTLILRDATAIVLGAGGAARAAVSALATFGPRKIIVRTRAVDEAKRRELQSIAVGTELTMESLDAPRAEVSSLACILQASSCGMQGGPDGDIVARAVHWESVPRAAIALDVVYIPRDTPFLIAARARSLRCDDGLGMLARQGALAFQHWLGVEPPLDVMRGALD